MTGYLDRREVLKLMGVGAAIAFSAPLLDAPPLFDTSEARAALPDPPVFPNQVGDALLYVTAAGTLCWACYVFAGPEDAPRDDLHYAKVIVPQALDLGAPTPTVFVVHGATATEECITQGKGGMIKVSHSWLDRGWPVIATRQGSKLNPKNGKATAVSATWGNQEARAGMVDAWEWASGAWTPDPLGFLLFGISMGGVGAFNFAAEAQRRRVPVGALYAIDGVTNLGGAFLTTASFRKPIRTAYGLGKYAVPGALEWADKVDGTDGGHDPHKFVADLHAFPVRLAASANDPLARRGMNADLMMYELATAEWVAEQSLLEYNGGHGSVKHFRPPDVNAFFDRALARENVPPVASFTHATSGLETAFDGSTAHDPDGFLVAHDWDFGDGALASGAVVTHEFAPGGSYTVTFTVTDNRGGQASSTVLIEAPPVEPPPEDPPE